MESKYTPRKRITSNRPPPSVQKQEVEAPGEFKSSSDPKKKEIIEKVYDLTSYRSIRDTWKQAREIGPDTKLQDASQWKAELEPRKTRVAGYNSSITNEPYQEFQLDVFFISKNMRKKKTKAQLAAGEKEEAGSRKMWSLR